jgi:hypothetical protein
VTGREGDLLLLSAAHLLTALGLAALVSPRRPAARQPALRALRRWRARRARSCLGLFSLWICAGARGCGCRYLPLAAAFLSRAGADPHRERSRLEARRSIWARCNPLRRFAVLLALFLPPATFARNVELLRQG